jgi:hypothetical protein
VRAKVESCNNAVLLTFLWSGTCCNLLVLAHYSDEYLFF